MSRWSPHRIWAEEERSGNRTPILKGTDTQRELQRLPIPEDVTTRVSGFAHVERRGSRGFALPDFQKGPARRERGPFEMITAWEPLPYLNSKDIGISRRVSKSTPV